MGLQYITNRKGFTCILRGVCSPTCKSTLELQKQVPPALKMYDQLQQITQETGVIFCLLILKL